MGLLVSGAAVTHCPRLDGLKQQIYSHTAWKPKVPKRGVRRATLPLEVLGENPSLPSPTSGGSRCFLACGCITPISAPLFTWPSLCVSPCISYEDTCHWI